MAAPAVFVVDDQASFRRAARAVVHAAGCVLAGEAETAAAARDALIGTGAGATERPDLVLIDVNLGGESGISLTLELTTGDPDLRIVLVSTMAEIDLPSDAGEAGALAFLEKSRLDPATLLELADAPRSHGV